MTFCTVFGPGGGGFVCLSFCKTAFVGLCNQADRAVLRQGGPSSLDGLAIVRGFLDGGTKRGIPKPAVGLIYCGGSLRPRGKEEIRKNRKLGK